MRVVFLLTLGIPVFAAQVVAFALPRVVEVAPFVLLRRAGDISAQEQRRDEVIARVVAQAPRVWLPRGFHVDAAPLHRAPDDLSARALTFVRHQRQQAT